MSRLDPIQVEAAPRAPVGRTRAAISRRMGNVAAGVLNRCGVFRQCFRSQMGLRILCYHGVCSDEAARQPWTPAHFVPVSLFEEHMFLLSRFGAVVHLPDVLDGGARPPQSNLPAFAVTFDDVAACTYDLARPVLARHGIRASFFISTGHATTGRLFYSDVLHLLSACPALVPKWCGSELRELVRRPNEHKLLPLGEQDRLIRDVERFLRRQLDPAIVNILRPMNWREIRALAAAGHDIGGHTAGHAILGRQSPEVRVAQIEQCLADIRRELQREPRSFAYPNGGPGDFDHRDADVLRKSGIRYALTMRPGFYQEGDRFTIPRVGIGKGHTPERFAMEISGVLDNRRQRRLGWEEQEVPPSRTTQPASEVTAIVSDR